jgi:hypothetical protein
MLLERSDEAKSKLGYINPLYGTTTSSFICILGRSGPKGRISTSTFSKMKRLFHILETALQS